jgi:hypothetical protein
MITVGIQEIFHIVETFKPEIISNYMFLKSLRLGRTIFCKMGEVFSY